MRRPVITAVACAIAAGAGIGVIGQAGSASAHLGTSASLHAAATSTIVAEAAKKKFSMKSRFAREKVVYGGLDSSPKTIDHVYELQYRLRWVGFFRGNASGYFGEQTEAAVKKFQKRHHLKVSGKATHTTWHKLIKKTVRGRKSIPKTCKKSGWHACYDRHRHQVTLWHNGTLQNSWLVRGGASRYKTRTGSYTVFLRSRHHVSSIYHTPMPYAQFFSGGQAFHASYYMTNPFSGHSHGCVNMYIKDARQLWNITSGETLHATIYGAWD